LKKRLKLKKVTLRDLDERTLGGIQGGETYGPLCTNLSICPGSCEDSGCDACGTHYCETNNPGETCDELICMCSWESTCC